MRLKTSTPGECRKALSSVLNMTASGKMDPKVSNCCIYALNSILNALRMDEQERRLVALEKKILTGGSEDG